MTTKIRIKLPLKTKESTASISSDSSVNEDDFDDDDGDDEPIDSRDLADGSYNPRSGKRKSGAPKKAKPGTAAKVVAPTGGDGALTAPAPGVQAAAAPVAAAAAAAAADEPLPPAMPPAQAKGLIVPDQFKHLQDLTAQERRLLDKFARTKRVTLKVLPRALGNAAERSKQEFERKRRERHMERDRTLTKRPKLMGYPSAGGGRDHRGGNGGAHGPALDGRGGGHTAHGAPAPPPPPPAQLQRGGPGPGSPSRPPHGAVAGGGPSGSEFPEEGFIMPATRWHTQQQNEPLILELPKLTFAEDPEGKGGNTVVIWATMPAASERFCVNISPTPDYNEKDPNTVVLYHFNPRDGWGKQHILQNTFSQMAWGKADRSIRGMPIRKNKEFQLRITIMPNEFHVFLDGKLLSVFRNRCDARFLRANESLYLIVPVVETHFGDKEDVIVHKIWWGHRSPRDVGGPARGGVPGAAPPVPGAAPPPPPPPRMSHGGPPPGGRFGGGGGDRGGFVGNRERGSSEWSRGTDRGGGSGGRHHRRPPPQLEERVLHVAGLSQDTHSAFNEMVRMFEHQGIEKDQSGQPRIKIVEGKGFGFVTLRDPASVEEAIKQLNGRPGSGGGTVQVARARKKNHHRR